MVCRNNWIQLTFSVKDDKNCSWQAYNCSSCVPTTLHMEQMSHSMEKYHWFILPKLGSIYCCVVVLQMDLTNGPFWVQSDSSQKFSTHAPTPYLSSVVLTFPINSLSSTTGNRALKNNSINQLSYFIVPLIDQIFYMVADRQSNFPKPIKITIQICQASEIDCLSRMGL